MKKLLVLTFVVIGFSIVSFGQSLSPAASSSATLIVPISIAKTGDMNFGTVSSSNTDGTVALAYDGAATPSGGARLVTGGALRTAAKFTVTGETTSSISILWPTSIVLKGTNNALHVLTVNNILADSGASKALSAGSMEILVKGTLLVPALSVADVYTNSTDLIVTVNYN